MCIGGVWWRMSVKVYLDVGPSACVRARVCVFIKIDYALAQVLYIFFSCIQQHQINNTTLFIQSIKINTQKRN